MPQINTVPTSNSLSFFTTKREFPNLIWNLMLKNPKGVGYNSAGAPIAEQLVPRL